MTSPHAHETSLGKGICYALFAYDIGLWVDLDEADRRVTVSKERGSLKPKRRTPYYFEYSPPPLRVTEEAPPLGIGSFQSSPGVEIMIFDFGALSVTYRIPIEGPVSALLALSEDLYENAQLLADSRRRVEDFLEAVQPAVERPRIADYVEDYVIVHLDTPAGSAAAPVWTGREQSLAQILRCERSALSEDEVRDALSHRISYGADDASFIDWNAALLFGPDLDDTRAVLEFANVELLEMRLLDHQLDRALDVAYEALSGKGRRPFRLPGSLEADTTRIARLQVDSALLFERVTNTLKLLGDQYLARVYRLASQRFHLESWDSGILRKIETLESIYTKMTDRAATRRMELLEWIIIALIAVSILVSF